MKIKISGLKVFEGERFPKGYGLAWRLYDEMAIVAYPIPLNFLARWFREVYLFLKFQGGARKNENYLLGYEKGREAGEQYGIQKGKKLHQEELLKNIEEYRKLHSTL